jgi:hypothetical protein
MKRLILISFASVCLVALQVFVTIAIWLITKAAA